MSSISWRTCVIGWSAPERVRVARQRDVGRVALERRAHLLGLEHRRALLERRLDRAPGEVRRLAHLAAPLGRQGADATRARSASGAAAAGVGHPHGLELREVGRAGDRRERLLLDRREVGLAHRPVRVSDPPGRRPLAHRLGQQRGARGGDVQRLGALGLRDRDAHDLAAVGEALERGAEARPLGAERQHQSAGSGRPPTAARRPAARPPARRSPRGWRGRRGSRPRAGAARTWPPSRRGPRAGGRRRPSRGRARASRRRARRRCARACRRCPGRRPRPGRRPSAGGKRTSRKLRDGRLGDDRDDPRGGGQAARLGHQLGRHQVALGAGRPWRRPAGRRRRAGRRPRASATGRAPAARAASTRSSPSATSRRRSRRTFLAWSARASCSAGLRGEVASRSPRGGARRRPGRSLGRRGRGRRGPRRTRAHGWRARRGSCGRARPRRA